MKIISNGRHLIFLGLLSASVVHGESSWTGFKSNILPDDCEPLTDITASPRQEGGFSLERVTISPSAIQYASSVCNVLTNKRCTLNLPDGNSDGFAVRGRVSNGRVCVTSYNTHIIYSEWLDQNEITAEAAPPPLPEDWTGTWHSVTSSQGFKGYSDHILTVKKDNGRIDLALYSLTAELPLRYIPIAYGGKGHFQLPVNIHKSMIFYNGEASNDPFARSEKTKLAGYLINGHLIVTISTDANSVSLGSSHSYIFVKGVAVPASMLLTSPALPVPY